MPRTKPLIVVHRCSTTVLNVRFRLDFGVGEVVDSTFAQFGHRVLLEVAVVAGVELKELSAPLQLTRIRASATASTAMLDPEGFIENLLWFVRPCIGVSFYYISLLVSWM